MPTALITIRPLLEVGQPGGVISKLNRIGSGSVIVIVALPLLPELSVTVTECSPSSNEFTVAVVSPVLHK